MRFLGVVLATVLASSLGTLVACSGQDREDSVPTEAAVNGATVKIALMDANGTRVGDASGVLLTPRLVLTAGHAISGKYTWQVTSADGKQKVVGSRGMTYDWMTYDSQKAHPRRHDIGVIHLDAPIKLDAYPRVVGDKTVGDMTATRIRGNGVSFDKLGVTLKKEKASPNNWLAEISPETLDTGGAVYDDRGILGVVSGRGLATNKLYVARADQLASWINDKVACATPTSSVRTYAPPAEDKSKVLCDDAGNPITDTTSSSSSGTSGQPTSSSPSGPSDGSCKDNNDGNCSGAGCPGTGGTNPAQPGQPSGDDDDSTGPNGPGDDDDDGKGGTNGTNPSGDDDDESATNPNGGPNGTPPGQSSGQPTTPGNGGTNTNKPSTSSSSGGNQSGNGSGKGNASSSGGAGSHHDNDESCQGANDNPEVCPPEPDGCSGSACGGGSPDELIDYGSCACGSTSTDDGKLHVR